MYIVHVAGGCRWVRVPALVYSAHVSTTVLPILSHIAFHDFSHSALPGPTTPSERLTLIAIYAPYLLVPLLLLVTMLFSSDYRPLPAPSWARQGDGRGAGASMGVGGVRAGSVGPRYEATAKAKRI